MTDEPSCAIRGASSRRWGVQAIVWTRAPGTSTQSGPPPNTSFSITVTPVLLELALRNLKVGLISNSHRCLVSFQQHFELQGLIAGAVSGSDHGYVKPHPSIFQAALRLLGVEAAESLMVGDSLPHDIDGARRVGMRGVLVQRSVEPSDSVSDVPVIHELGQLLALL